MSDLFKAEENKLFHEGRITLYEIDLSIFGEGVFYLTPAADQVDSDTVTSFSFGAREYAPHPVEMTGVERTVTGPLPRPTLRIGNPGSMFTALLEANGDLRGATVRRIVTYAKFLDGMPDADDTAHRPVEEYVINRKMSHSTYTQVVEFELVAAMDQEKANLPRGTCLRDFCPLVYRKWNGSSFVYDTTEEGCPYTDAVYFTSDDTSTANPALDDCSKRLSGCVARYGDDPLPFGNFPGMSRVRIT